MSIDLKAPVESPFKSDNTASNRCGFTLMNNQVGAVVAEVMATKDNVKVMPLPSMIRVDAVGRMDVVYAEISRRSVRSRATSTPPSSRRTCRPTMVG